MPPGAIAPDPVALIGPQPGPADILDATLLCFRREAAHPPSRQLTRTLRQGGEPVALTGRLGGTDEFLGAALARPQCSLGVTERALDPDNVFGAASCGDLGWNVASAADAKESKASRELCEKEENSSQFRGVTVDMRGH